MLMYPNQNSPFSGCRFLQFALELGPVATHSEWAACGIFRYVSQVREGRYSTKSSGVTIPSALFVGSPLSVITMAYRRGLPSRIAELKASSAS